MSLFSKQDWLNFYEKITVFEGYLDSIFFPNCIGTTGVETAYSFLLEELDIRFFYDNDEVGVRKSIEKLKEGYSVFLWKKFFKDLSKGDTKKEYYLNNHIKDLNEFLESHAEGGDDGGRKSGGPFRKEACNE